jgi:hypothetical protein
MLTTVSMAAKKAYYDNMITKSQNSLGAMMNLVEIIQVDNINYKQF